MLVMNNALKSIIRSKGGNVLIGIIVLAIAASSCVALAIRNAANEATQVGLDSMRITGSISVDRQRMMEMAQDGIGDIPGGSRGAARDMMSTAQGLSLDELMIYAESDNIEDFYYSTSVSLSASGDLEAYGSDAGNSGGMGGVFGGGRGGMGIAMGDFTVTGYSSEEAMTKFVTGISQMSDGGMFDVASDSMDCIISIELALYNGLSAGDTITLANPGAEDEIYTFTVTGMYSDSSSGETGGQMRFSTAQDPANLICISHGALQKIIDHSASVAVTETIEVMGGSVERSSAVSGQLSSSFVFSGKESYELFGEELTAAGLPDYYTLTSSDINSYEAGLVPLQNLSGFATTLLFVVLAIGAVILIVLNIFNIRERKYEVGVLTAIGIKKGKVAMQFVTELLCVTLAAIIIGAGVGAAVSVPVSNNLLSAQIEQMQAEAESQEQRFGRPGGGMGGFADGGRGRQDGMLSLFGLGGGQAEVTYLDKINATINFSVLLQLIGIGIILTLVSSFAAVVFVMRYEPLKILANRT